MVEATLPLNFYDPAAGRPTGKYSIIISCSTSAYGDYMVGCTTNVMYVDDFQWVYCPGAGQVRRQLRRYKEKRLNPWVQPFCCRFRLFNSCRSYLRAIRQYLS